MSAPRDTAARALAQLLHEGEPWPSPDPLRLRNLLLDACGSDHRALVQLLLRVGRHGVAEALRALGPVSPAQWADHRPRLVAHACGALFIEREVATWAVDAWAVALRVIAADAADALQREYAAQARRAEVERAREVARAAVLARTQAALSAIGVSASGPLPAGGGAPLPGAGAWSGVGGPGRPLTGTGGLLANPRWGGTSASVLAQPTWTGATGAGRAGAWRRGRVGSPRWRVPASPLPPPDLRRFFALFAVVSVVLFALIQQARRFSPAMRPPRALAMRPLAAAPRDTAPRDTAPRDTVPAVVRPVPPARVLAGPAGPAGAADTAGPTGAAGAVRRAPTVREAGIGGRYRVEQRSVSVFGGDLCDPVADALAARSRVSEEEFAHVPGQADFTMVSRGEVRGTLEADGVFATAVHRSTHDRVRLEFRMVGRFTPDGFVARTTTASDAVLRYRERQQCVVRADLLGTRLR